MQLYIRVSKMVISAPLTIALVEVWITVDTGPRSSHSIGQVGSRVKSSMNLFKWWEVFKISLLICMNRSSITSTMRISLKITKPKLVIVMYRKVGTPRILSLEGGSAINDFSTKWSRTACPVNWRMSGSGSELIGL